MDKQVRNLTLQIKKIYLKSCNLESPRSPASFQEKIDGRAHVDVNGNLQKLGEGSYECTLSISMRSKTEKNQTCYILDLQQAGLFSVSGDIDPTTEKFIVAQCSNILLPYAREQIDSLLVKAGFPPIYLAIPNFEHSVHSVDSRDLDPEKKDWSDDSGGANLAH